MNDSSDSWVHEIGQLIGLEDYAGSEFTKSWIGKIP